MISKSDLDELNINLSVDFIGDGYEYLADYSKAIGLKDVNFLGHLTRSVVNNQLQAAHCEYTTTVDAYTH